MQWLDAHAINLFSFVHVKTRKWIFGFCKICVNCAYSPTHNSYSLRFSFMHICISFDSGSECTNMRLRIEQNRERDRNMVALLVNALRVKKKISSQANH